MVPYAQSHGTYLWSSVLILAGNNAAPMFLRGLVRLMHASADALGFDKVGLRFAL